ncbi:cysteine-rich venom protein 6-like [Augochlora pura]
MAGCIERTNTPTGNADYFRQGLTTFICSVKRDQTYSNRCANHWKIKMSRSMIFVLAIVAVLCVVVEGNSKCCPPNEVWDDCGTACPGTCELPNPPICTHDCVIGCRCKSGLVRNKNWKCVPLSACSL